MGLSYCRGEMGHNLLLKHHRHHKRSTFPVCYTRCLTQGEAWHRWLFSALLWFDPAAEICCLFVTLEQDRQAFKRKKRHTCKLQFPAKNLYRQGPRKANFKLRNYFFREETLCIQFNNFRCSLPFPFNNSVSDICFINICYMIQLLLSLRTGNYPEAS